VRLAAVDDTLRNRFSRTTVPVDKQQAIEEIGICDEALASQVDSTISSRLECHAATPEVNPRARRSLCRIHERTELFSAPPVVQRDALTRNQATRELPCDLGLAMY
jgi:hypothetical protein